MAITEEEKKMALALYEKYSDVFDSIYDALVAFGTIDFSTSKIAQSKGREIGRLAVKINNKIFSNENVRLLFQDILKYLVDERLILKLPLPWGKSKNRYIITNEKIPVHPNGRDFFYPVSYRTYKMESHYARERALTVVKQLCDKLDLEFEVIDV
jgi:hypothetical protein